MLNLALLRGINVGGKAVLPMRELTAAFLAAGATDVRTYIQSGNVVFAAQDPARTAAAVTSAIASRFGYPGRIVLRTAAEMNTCLIANPFLKAGAALETLHVYFLADKPAPAAVKALDPDRCLGSSFFVHQRDIYLHLPAGMARTKLTNAYFDAKLQTVSTARNWNTITRLAAMLNDA